MRKYRIKTQEVDYYEFPYRGWVDQRFLGLWFECSDSVCFSKTREQAAATALYKYRNSLAREGSVQVHEPLD